MVSKIDKKIFSQIVYFFLLQNQVLLQPFNYDPSEKNKHKFMVQYLYLNDEEMQLSVNDILNMV